MKTLTFKRDAGYKSVVQFANGTSYAVSTKTFRTQKGAEAANNRLREVCGENWEIMNMPYDATAEDGTVTKLYRKENRVVI